MLCPKAKFILATDNEFRLKIGLFQVYGRIVLQRFLTVTKSFRYEKL